jgi:hypothetical protein
LNDTFARPGSFPLAFARFGVVVEAFADLL